MSRVIAAIDGGLATRPVVLAARALAVGLHADVHALHAGNDATESVEAHAASLEVPLELADGPPAAAVVAAMAADDVIAGAVGLRRSEAGSHIIGSVALTILENATKPVLVVPPSLGRTRVQRVLLPVESRATLATPVVATLRALTDAGASLVAVHVFTPESAPVIVDREYYDIPDWTVDLIESACPGLRPPVEIRSGRPSDQIVAVADELDVDLIVLVSSQRYLHGHGEVVEEVLRRTRVPTLVFPADVDVRETEGGRAARPVVDEGVRPIDLLLIEDDLGDVRLTSEALDAANLANTLHVVRDGDSALAFLRRQPPYEDAPRPGLVLLDLNLPRVDGRELLATVKGDRELRDIPVVVLTTSTSPADVDLVYRLGASCFVTKPVRFTDFVAAVRSLGQFWIGAVTLPDYTPSTTTVSTGQPM